EHSFLRSEGALLGIQLHVYLSHSLESFFDISEDFLFRRKASLCSSTLPDLCGKLFFLRHPLPYVFDEIPWWMPLDSFPMLSGLLEGVSGSAIHLHSASITGFSGEKVLILYVLAWRRRLDSRRAEFLLASVSFIVSFLRRSNESTRLGAFPDELFRPSEVRVDYSA
ncbi:hypothetical protein Tco_1286207, partial [Tanacetum coccineum]